MGFNTTVFILNDHLYDISKNPEAWAKEVISAIHKGKETDWVMGQTTVMQTAHADIHRLYMSHGNAMIDLSMPYSFKDKLKGRGDRRSREHLIEYYRQQIKIAKSMLKDFTKELDKIEAQEKIDVVAANKKAMGVQE